jgi:hypothetical protein
MLLIFMLFGGEKMEGLAPAIFLGFMLPLECRSSGWCSRDCGSRA